MMGFNFYFSRGRKSIVSNWRLRRVGGKISVVLRGRLFPKAAFQKTHAIN